MAWITPKTDWTSADGIDFNDLNRIEGNIKFIADNPVGTLLRLGEGTRNVAIGAVTVDSGPRLVVAEGVGSLPSLSANTVAVFHNNSLTTDESSISVISGTSGVSSINLGDSTNEDVNNIAADNALNTMLFTTATVERMRISTAGNLLIKKTSDTGEVLQVNGSARFTGSTGNVIIDSTGAITADGGIDTDNAVLKTKVIDIGDWDMVTNSLKDVTHGVNYKKIRGIEVTIRDDDDDNYDMFDGSNASHVTFGHILGPGGTGIGSTTDIRLLRETYFDNTDYDSTSYNRGWVKVMYEV